jgi:hypothetical protein
VNWRESRVYKMVILYARDSCFLNTYRCTWIQTVTFGEGGSRSITPSTLGEDDQVLCISKFRSCPLPGDNYTHNGSSEVTILVSLVSRRNRVHFIYTWLPLSVYKDLDSTFRPIRVDHTEFFQVAIKTHQFNIHVRVYTQSQAKKVATGPAHPRPSEIRQRVLRASKFRSWSLRSDSYTHTGEGSFGRNRDMLLYTWLSLYTHTHTSTSKTLARYCVVFSSVLYRVDSVK